MPTGIGTSGLPDYLPFKIKKDNELIVESIYNILTTRKGERVGNPEFGSDLYRYVFNPHLETYWESVKLEVIKSVEQFEPRVIVLNVEFVKDETNNKLTLIVLFFSLLTQSIENFSVMNMVP